MIRVKKTHLPEGVSISQPRDWRTSPVYDLIKTDCYGKCYICEDCSTTIQVEHMDPNEAHRYVWENLMLACGHCNGIKNIYYWPIINCMEEDPEEIFIFRTEPYPESDVVVRRRNADDNRDEVCNTENLLMDVYNSSRTKIRSDECQRLRERLYDEIIAFQETMKKIMRPSTPEERKQELLDEIKYKLSRKSVFSAFKREVIRSNTRLYERYGQYLD